MLNYKFVIQYEGTRYRGWQKQTGTENTLQQKFETLFSRMFGREITVDGAGRTDSGVHAAGQVFSVKLPWDQSCDQLQREVNRYLPDDIAVRTVEVVPDRFHARLNAKGKRYEYRILTGGVKDVFARRYAYSIEDRPDVERMRQAAERLVGKHDFTAFQSNRHLKKSAVRTIYSIDIREDGEELHIVYEGDGFLYHMIRILSGTILEAGRGERSLESIDEALKSGDRNLAGELLPGQGLTLLEVFY